MAYMALYRKYRPQTFTDVVGQHQVSDTLMRAIREDKVAHAYLFAGRAGLVRRVWLRFLHVPLIVNMALPTILVMNVAYVIDFEWSIYGRPRN